MTVRGELDAYGQGLTDKPEIVALTKVDAMTPEAIKEQIAKLKKAGEEDAARHVVAIRRGRARSVARARKIIAQMAASMKRNASAAWQP